MPKLGLTMENGTVVEWRCREGQRVARGEVVLLIESEKVEFEVEAPEEGFVRSIVAAEAETVPCGAVLAVLTGSADEPLDLAAFLETTRRPRAEAPSSKGPAPAPGASRPPRAGAPRRASPRARRLAEREGVSLVDVEGTGPEGRITEEDVRHAIESLGPRISVGHARIAYSDAAGPEPAVLFLAGFGIDRTAFNRTVADLAGFRRLLAADLRGTGGSTDPDEEPLRIERLSEDLEKLLEARSLKRTDVVGSSLGAAVAVELARRFPDRVRRLVLLSPPGYPDARLAAALDGFCRIAESAGPDIRLRVMAPWLFGRAFLSDRVGLQRTLGALAGATARISPRTLRRQAEALGAWLEGAGEAYAAVRVPALIVVGTDDLLTPVPHAEAVGATLAGSRIECLAKVGHAPMVEAPDRLRALLRDFLEAEST